MKRAIPVGVEVAHGTPYPVSFVRLISIEEGMWWAETGSFCRAPYGNLHGIHRHCGGCESNPTRYSLRLFPLFTSTVSKRISRSLVDSYILLQPLMWA